MSALVRTPSGDVAIPLKIETDRATLTRQKITDQFNLWLGEWFLDTTQGFPWIQRVLGIKNPSLTQLRSLFREAILEAPGVSSVDQLTLSVNPQTRGLSVDALQITLNNGEVLTGGAGQPFRVTGGAS